MQKVISGIQQAGIGIANVHEAWTWYREHFGMDIAAFDEVGTADLMLPYTGGEAHERHAIMSLNLKGGGGFEIWQYKSRLPQAPQFDVQLGDLGIFALKIKTDNISETYHHFNVHKIPVSKRIYEDPRGRKFFFVKDPYGNVFQMTQGKNWFSKNNKNTGGVAGAIIGVSDIDKSTQFYKRIFGYDRILFDMKDKFDEFSWLKGGNHTFRRVQLTHSTPREGAFSRLLGNSKIELVQVLDREPEKIFKDRFWGDLGFIHLCFDIKNIEQFKIDCQKEGFPFTVDSRDGKLSGKSFAMEDTSGDVAYIEDPDGTLMEMVEVHRIPLMKKIGWYLNLKKRNYKKPLPDWMIKMLNFKRFKASGFIN